ncbi:MAG: MFS transporter [Bacteriovoracia bacterium]
MKQEMSVHDILIRLGVFRALYAAAVQFNSVLFRVIVGVLALSFGVPADTVALVTLIEFTLNGLLEVPCGYISDRIGRIPSIILSLLLVMSGLACVYVALVFDGAMARILFIAHGILIGIAKPLSSGSIEAFYQDAIKVRCLNDDHEKVAATSLTTSQNYGKYFTTIAVIAAFALAWVFEQKQWLPHTFLIGIALYASCIVTLWRDYLQLGDRDKQLHVSPLKDIFKVTFLAPRAKIATIYNLSFWMMTVIIAGYLPLSLGREHNQSAELIQWSFMAAFMLGYSAFGWILKGHLLPVLIRCVTPRQYLLIFYGLTLVMSLGYLALYGNTPVFVQITYIFVFGALFHTATSAIQNMSMNQLMGEVKRQDYATALSFQNIPGYLWVGLYSLYISTLRNGAPSIKEAFVSVVILSLLFSFVTISLERPLAMAKEIK